MKAGQTGEDRLLGRLLSLLGNAGGVIAGAGDDCAVLSGPDRDRLLLFKTDCAVEGVHFESNAPPTAIGWKAMMRPLSDFAAMSGIPQFALITLIVPASCSTEWIEKLYRGLGRAGERFDVAIVGGETSSTSGPIVISVSVVGWVEKDRWVSRKGGKPGDDVFVTGRLGGSRAAKQFQFVPRIEESRWLTAHFDIHAMMDLSDGLGADLPRLARASDVGFEVDPEAVPRTRSSSVEAAFADGEDYELLFTLRPRAGQRLEKAWRRKFGKLPLTRIGRLRKTKTRGQNLPGGYVHFQ